MWSTIKLILLIADFQSQDCFLLENESHEAILLLLLSPVY